VHDRAAQVGYRFVGVAQPTPLAVHAGVRVVDDLFRDLRHRFRDYRPDQQRRQAQ